MKGGAPTVFFFFFFALVGDSPFVLLPGLPGVGGTMQLRAGQGRGGERRKSSRPPRRWGGQGGRDAGVAPGVRHNPVFGSPGEEFPPLHPCHPPFPPSPPNSQSPGPGAPPGVPEMRGLSHPTQCCRGSEEGHGQAPPGDKAGRGWAGAYPGQRAREGKDPSPRELAPAKAWKEGSA